MNRRTLLSLLVSSALALGAIVLPATSAQARPGEVAPCYGVRYTPPPPPAPKKPVRPAKPRGR